MCGIFGYIGPGSSVDISLHGLKNLEYRGYDSAGIAGISDKSLKICRSPGKLDQLKKLVDKAELKLDIAIAHTRWATHGSANEANAHPHADHKHSLAIVHNGIIENYRGLRDKLIEHGVTFASETDSEVIANLISFYYKNDLRKAVHKALRKLEGSLAIAVIHQNHPEEIVVAARENPLSVAYDPQTGEVFLSSDPNAFSGKSLNVAFLQRNEVALLSKKGISFYDEKETSVEKPFHLMRFEHNAASKNGYDHYMLKEIFEQPQTIQRAMQGRISEEYGTSLFDTLSFTPQQLQSVNRILILACGTSWHAGCVALSLFEGIARIPTEVEIASEFRYSNPIISKNTLVIAISQSGETADTLAALREAKAKGAKTLGICNVRHSTLAREAEACLFLEAGPEISVCSTKAFTSQLVVLLLFTLHMARLGYMSKQDGQQFIADLKKLPVIVTQVLAQSEYIESIAEKYSRFDQFFFIGRRFMYPTSLEGALKLKEISYLHAMGYPAGELKHGPIALVNPDLAVVGMCGNGQTYDKLISNLMEVKARGGVILAFAPKGCTKIVHVADDIVYIPQVPDHMASIPYSVAAQLLAYHIAKKRGTNIDQPRNLAKSVTVE